MVWFSQRNLCVFGKTDKLNNSSVVDFLVSIFETDQSLLAQTNSEPLKMEATHRDLNSEFHRPTQCREYSEHYYVRNSCMKYL